MGNLEPAGHFIEGNLGEFLSTSHPQLTTRQCESPLALCILSQQVWAGQGELPVNEDLIWRPGPPSGHTVLQREGLPGTPALFQDTGGHCHW